MALTGGKLVVSLTRHGTDIPFDPLSGYSLLVFDTAGGELSWNDYSLPAPGAAAPANWSRPRTAASSWPAARRPRANRPSTWPGWARTARSCGRSWPRVTAFATPCSPRTAGFTCSPRPRSRATI
ncbi:hypothetical protein [Nannocystis pusilla]|uniref:hypothetical protein n=1 Tax=Nannocystis pusilla TaxID=889268 RepID=UPI003B82B0A1